MNTDIITTSITYVFPVIGSTDTGMLEGIFRGHTGCFPAQCVQEVRLRNPDGLRVNNNKHNASAISSPYSAAQPNTTTNIPPSPAGGTPNFNNGTRVAGRREAREQQQQLQQHFATASRHKDKMCVLDQLTSSDNIFTY